MEGGRASAGGSREPRDRVGACSSEGGTGRGQRGEGRGRSSPDARGGARPVPRTHRRTGAPAVAVTLAGFPAHFPGPPGVSRAPWFPCGARMRDRSLISQGRPTAEPLYGWRLRRRGLACGPVGSLRAAWRVVSRDPPPAERIRAPGPALPVRSPERADRRPRCMVPGNRCVRVQVPSRSERLSVVPRMQRRSAERSVSASKHRALGQRLGRRRQDGRTVARRRLCHARHRCGPRSLWRYCHCTTPERSRRYGHSAVPGRGRCVIRGTFGGGSHRLARGRGERVRR